MDAVDQASFVVVIRLLKARAKEFSRQKLVLYVLWTRIVEAAVSFEADTAEYVNMFSDTEREIEGKSDVEMYYETSFENKKKILPV